MHQHLLPPGFDVGKRGPRHADFRGQLLLGAVRPVTVAPDVVAHFLVDVSRFHAACITGNDTIANRANAYVCYKNYYTVL